MTQQCVIHEFAIKKRPKEETKKISAGAGNVMFGKWEVWNPPKSAPLVAF